MPKDPVPQSDVQHVRGLQAEDLPAVRERRAGQDTGGEHSRHDGGSPHAAREGADAAAGLAVSRQVQEHPPRVQVPVDESRSDRVLPRYGSYHIQKRSVQSHVLHAAGPVEGAAGREGVAADELRQRRPDRRLHQHRVLPDERDQDTHADEDRRRL